MIFDRWRPALRLPAFVAAALVTAAVGVWLLAGAGGHATRHHRTISGVPLDEVYPLSAGPHPGVVVAHGFAGSARLMAQFGDSLAAQGYVVVLLDFAGHGANRQPLPDNAASTDASTAALQHDLDVATAHLRALPDVDPTRIALVGHSMGATAVTRYAAAHAEITATVAISLPDSSAVQRDRPARLLVLVGAFEFPGFRTEAERAVAHQGPTSSMVVVPGVEHISILYAPRTHRETAAWLARSFGQPRAVRPMPAPLRRVGGAAVLLLALLAGLYPIARLLLGAPEERHPLRRGWEVSAVAATVIAALVAPRLPTDRLPIAIGGYLVGFTSVAGLLMLGYHLWRGPRIAYRRRWWPAPVLIAYAAVAIAVPTHLGLTYAIPGGRRWWLLALLWAGFAVLAYATERVTAGNSLALLAVSAIAMAALTAAAAVGLTYGFVLLVVPLIAVLLVWQATWSAILHRFGAPPGLIALVGSLVVAWPLATALPVTG